MSDRDVLKQLLRQDPSSFIQKAFQTVSPGDVYRHGWHIDAIAWALHLRPGSDAHSSFYAAYRHQKWCL